MNPEGVTLLAYQTAMVITELGGWLAIEFVIEVLRK